MEYNNEKLPQKVEMMFQAVIDMINEGSDINTMKVQEITNRAGIGKGTAYEYFSSKEELIGAAIDWKLRSEILDLAQMIDGCDGFRQKIYRIMNFMEEKVCAQNSLLQIMGTSTTSCCISHNMKDALKNSRYPELIKDLLDNTMEDGVREGVLSSNASMYNRKTSLVSQLLMFLGYLKQEGEESREPLENVKEQIYQNILLLNR